jgi:hypothetical protein
VKACTLIGERSIKPFERAALAVAADAGYGTRSTGYGNSVSSLIKLLVFAVLRK